MKIRRNKTREINIGGVRIGGGNPIAIQSMTKTATSDVTATVRQIKKLKNAGALLVRCAVKDIKDARAIKDIKKKTDMPLIADIHFDYNLALEAIKSRADKIRLNPGNIYKKEHVGLVVKAAKKAGIPIRVGANSGSVPDSSSVNRLVEVTSDYIKLLESMDFYDIVISVKSSDILETVRSYRMISKVFDYPLHLGLTATGGMESGVVKSSIAIGALLLEGIGDTIRISLTADPIDEIKVAKNILSGLNLENFGPQIISCPTCGRCEVNLVGIVNDLENRISRVDQRQIGRPVKLAVMGCVVNGPGEAREAELGIAFGKTKGALFKRGKVIRNVSEKESVDSILQELKNL